MTFQRGHHPVHDVAAAGRKGKARSPWGRERPVPVRDPRVDPQPDDQITVGNETREVLSVTNGRVYYSWPGKLAVRSLHLSAWRDWAAREAA